MTKPITLVDTAAPKSNLNKTSKKSHAKTTKTKTKIPTVIKSISKTIDYNALVNAYANPTTDPNLMFTPFRTLNITPEIMAQLACELIEWSREEDSLKVSDFFLQYNIINTTMYEWATKYPCIKHALEVAKGIIGNRREKGALKNEYSSTIVRASMSMYDDQWKADEDRKAKIAKVDAVPSNININIPELIAMPEDGH